MSGADFWSNNTEAQTISKEASSYEKILNLLHTLETVSYTHLTLPTKA